MDHDQENTKLLEKSDSDSPAECICLSMMCCSAVFIPIIVAIVIIVVASPLAFSRPNKYIEIEYIYQGQAPSFAAQDAIFGAVQIWSQYIYALDDPITLPAGVYCGGRAEISSDRAVRGVLVVFEIKAIDGEGGTLGYAGPCVVDTNDLPRMGIVVLDEADIQPLMQIGEFRLEEVVMHEMAHVMGFGTLWLPNKTYHVPAPHAGAGYSYNLPGANREHVAYGAFGESALVEDEGSENGTRGSHWKEDFYLDELMTGYVAGGGTRSTLSRITLGALADLGFRVNMDVPDQYVLPATALRRRLRTEKQHYINDSFNFVGT